jgi:putative cell wall-binding protein
MLEAARPPPDDWAVRSCSPTAPRRRKATKSALTCGKPTKVVILGGEAVIGLAVFLQVKTLLIPGATVERWAGADRYATAAWISSMTCTQGATTACLASGASYPDALAGARVAAHAGAPLLLTPRDRIPASTFAELTRLGATNIVVLGGTSAVSQAAANLTGCTSWPSRHFEEHDRQRCSWTSVLWIVRGRIRLALLDGRQGYAVQPGGLA